MRVQFCLAILFALLAFLSFHVNAHIPIPESNGKPLNEKQMRILYEKFIRKYSKDTSLYRNANTFAIFQRNVEEARQMNLEHGSNVFGITKFSDMDANTFAKTRLLKKFTPAQFRQENKKNSRSPLFGLSNMFKKSNLTSFDWREHGAVTPVKDQGSCGSCWSFSTTGNIEGVWFLSPKSGNKLVSLSEQNLVDCDDVCDEQGNCDLGCDGGYMWNAYEYIISNGGIDTEESYPYEATQDKCRYNNATRGAVISSWTMLPSDEDALVSWIVKHGPFAVALNASPLRYYSRGVLNPARCDPEALDHAVLIVGFGTEKNAEGEDQKYWIVKNSWSSNWGENGYFRIARGTNACGIESVAQTALV